MVCRLCLVTIPSGEEVSIFRTSNSDSDYDVVKMIARHLRLEIMQNDAISTTICLLCCKHLNDFNEFSMYVDKKQETLRNQLSAGMVADWESDQENVVLSSGSTSSPQDPLEVQLKCEPEDYNMNTERADLSNDENTAIDASSENVPGLMSTITGCLKTEFDDEIQSPKPLSSEVSLSTKEFLLNSQSHWCYVNTSMEKMLQTLSKILSRIPPIVYKEPIPAAVLLFPANSEEALHRVNNYAKENLQACVSIIKEIILPKGLLKNFHRLIGEEIIQNYNFCGVSSKKSLKEFKSFNMAIFEALRKEGYTEVEFMVEIRHCLRTLKNRYFKKQNLKKKKLKEEEIKK